MEESRTSAALLLLPPAAKNLGRWQALGAVITAGERGGRRGGEGKARRVESRLDRGANSQTCETRKHQSAAQDKRETKDHGPRVPSKNSSEDLGRAHVPAHLRREEAERRVRGGEEATACDTDVG